MVASFGHGCLPFFYTPSGRPSPRLYRSPVGDAVKPTANRRSVAHGCRLASQYQKSRLEGVFGIMSPAQNPATDAKDHWAMPLHQGFECRLITLGKEALQELNVLRSSLSLAQGYPAKMTKDATGGNNRHQYALSSQTRADSRNSAFRRAGASVFFSTEKK
jgi:hypothetical protein